MICDTKTWKEKVFAGLLSTRLNWQECRDIVLDTLTGRIAGGIFFDRFVKNSSCFEELKGSLSHRIGRDLRVILEERAFKKVDLISLRVTRTLCRHSLLLQGISSVEEMITRSWLNLIQQFNVTSMNEESAYSTSFLEQFCSLATQVIESVRKMDDRSPIKDGLIESVSYKIQSHIPEIYREEFFEDIDELVKEFFSSRYSNFDLFKRRLASKMSVNLKPHLAEAIKPIIRLAIPHIAAIGEKMIREETDGVTNWLGYQVSSIASSEILSLLILKFAHFFSDSDDDFSTGVIFGTTLAANLGFIVFQFFQTSQKRIEASRVHASLVERFGEDLRAALANTIADFHNSLVEESLAKEPTSFTGYISDELIEFIMDKIAKRTLAMMNID